MIGIVTGPRNGVGRATYSPARDPSFISGRGATGRAAVSGRPTDGTVARLTDIILGR
jgi:hypothetical protein